MYLTSIALSVDTVPDMVLTLSIVITTASTVTGTVDRMIYASL